MRLFAAHKVHDPQVCKLGRRYVRFDSRTLRLGKYLRPGLLPPAPPSVDWADAVTDWGPLLNNKIGDCTVASCGHLEQSWTANAGKEFVPSDASIEMAYEAVSGYDGSPATDSGAVEIDVLNYWRQTGIAGRAITAYAAVDAANLEAVRQAIYLFGGLYIGLALPLSAQNQEVWDTTLWGRLNGSGEPGSWGGHCLPILAYDGDGLTCVTWGAKKRMTWNFFSKYCDEAYAVLSQDWMNTRGVDPNGFQFADLLSDLALVTGATGGTKR